VIELTSSLFYILSKSFPYSTFHFRVKSVISFLRSELSTFETKMHIHFTSLTRKTNTRNFGLGTISQHKSSNFIPRFHANAAALIKPNKHNSGELHKLHANVPAEYTPPLKQRRPLQNWFNGENPPGSAKRIKITGKRFARVNASLCFLQQWKLASLFWYFLVIYRGGDLTVRIIIPLLFEPFRGR